MLQIGTEVELTIRFSRHTTNIRLEWVRDHQGRELCKSRVELALPPKQL
jgi:hypothetical protein